MRYVAADYDPRADNPRLASASDSASADGASATAPAQVHPEVFEWFWQEDEHRIGNRDPSQLFHEADGTSTRFVRYSAAVNTQIENAYLSWVNGSTSSVVPVDLAGGAKLYAADSGSQFVIDFEAMEQRNTKTNFARAVRREAVPGKTAPSATLKPRPSKVTRKATTSIKRGTSTRGGVSVSEGDGGMPEDLADEDALMLRQGQLVQVSKQRSDGWAFGSVIYDEQEDRPPIAVEGVSTQAGWFALERTELPSPQQFARLQKVLGEGGASDALKPPDTWQDVKDPLVAERFGLDLRGSEAQVVSAFFTKTLGYGANKVKIQSIERVQNVSMWQSYAVKRQTVLQREAPTRTH